MKFYHDLENWFFIKIDVRQYAILRIGLGLLIFIYLCQLYPLIDLHFNPEGWQTNTDLSAFSSWSILNLLANTYEVKVCWVLALSAIFCFTIGFYACISGLFCWIVLVSIWHYNPLVLDGDDALLRMSLLYMLFSPCDNAYSIKKKTEPFSKQAFIWPLRLMQFQLLIVYFFSGWFKFLNPEWMNGQILNSILIHPQYSRWDLSYFVKQPWIIDVLKPISQLICWWEMLFPVLLCHKSFRQVCICIGIFFHLTLLVTMHIRGFSLIMLVLYMVFLPKKWFEYTLCNKNL